MATNMNSLGSHNPIPYMVVTSGSVALSEGSMEPVEGVKRVILPLIAGDQCTFIGSYLKGLHGLPGCETALLGITEASQKEWDSAGTGTPMTLCLPREKKMAEGVNATVHRRPLYARRVGQQLTDLICDAPPLLFTEALNGLNRLHPRPLTHLGGIDMQWEEKVSSRASRLYERFYKSMVGEPQEGDAPSIEEVDSAMEELVAFGQTKPHGVPYLPVPLPPSMSPPFTEHVEHEEDRYHCWASNSFSNAPCLDFPHMSPSTLVTVMEHMMKLSSMHPEETTDLNICASLGNPSEISSLPECEARERVQEAVETMAAAVFLAMS